MTVKADPFVLTIIFDVCANLGDEKALEVGRLVFSQMDSSYYGNTVVMTSALNMFMKDGDVNKAEEVFRSIKSKDIIAYAAMMKGYILNNDPRRTLALFDQIKKKSIELSAVIYVLAIHACAQIGMIQCSRPIVAQIPDQFRNDQILQNTLIDMWASRTSV